MKMVIVIRMIFVTSFLALQCCHNSSEATSFEIERGELDTFKNIKCTEQGNCKERQCKIYGAKCVESKYCTRCQCKDGRGTFLSTNGDNTYNCTKDEDIIPESGKMNRVISNKLNLHANMVANCLSVLNAVIYKQRCQYFNICLKVNWGQLNNIGF